MYEWIASGLETLGLSQDIPAQAARQLEAYGHALIQQNQVMNLTAITQPKDVATLHMLDCAPLLECAQLLAARGIEAEIVKWNIITPLDTGEVVRSVTKTGHLLVAEECVQQGCVGVRVLAALEEAGVPAKTALANCGRGYVTHGSVEQLKESLGLDGAGLFRRAMEVLGREQ